MLEFLHKMTNQKPYIIGITGGSGSGKTTIIKLLRETFGEKELSLVSQDNYYRPREEQEIDENGVVNFDLPNCIDHSKFLADINALRSGKSIELPEYTFNNALATPRMIKVDSTPIIIVEGLFVFFYEELRELMDLKVYVDASDIVKIKRRINRDQTERNYPIDDVLYRYEYHVTPAFESYILPYKKMADIVINNEHSYEQALEVLKGFIRNKIIPQ